MPILGVLILSFLCLVPLMIYGSGVTDSVSAALYTRAKTHSNATRTAIALTNDLLFGTVTLVLTPQPPTTTPHHNHVIALLTRINNPLGIVIPTIITTTTHT